MLNYLLPYEVWLDGPLGVIHHLKRPEIRSQFAPSLQALPLGQTHIAWVAGKVKKTAIVRARYWINMQSTLDKNQPMHCVIC